jgi:hypothetical protein
MTTLRQAVQEFVSDYDCGGCGHFQYYAERFRTALRAALEQPEQEPVAWIHRKHYLLGHAENMPPADKALAQGWEPLYTHPPRREWQGLSEEEINAVAAELGYAQLTPREVARAVEQALKEKNNV